MGTAVPALLLLLVLAAAVSAADMQVRVYLDGKEDAAGLHPLGLDVVWQGKDFIEIIATADELRELEGLGLRTEIVHGDVAAFYRSRLDHARDMGGYKTLAEIQAYMDEIAFFHDAIVFPKTVIGYTLEGRPMYAMKISDNPELDEPDEPEVLYTAAIHAREVITPETVLRFMDYLTDNYGTDPAVTDLVNSRELWFVPVVNPDGYYYNQVIEPDGGGMWRKNRRNNGDGSYGIDLNRNYGYEWGYDDDGSSPVPSDATYRGTGPFSEPETQVMRDFISAHEFVFTLYFHSYSNLVLWPWGYDQIYTPEEPLFRILGDSLAAYNGYEPTPSWGLYVVNGSSDDWGYGEQLLKNKNYAFSIEIGGYSDGFWPDPSRIDQLTLENRGPALFLARVAGNPYQVMPPGQPAVSVDDTVDASGYSVQWSLADTLNPAVLWELVELQGFGRTTDQANAWDNFSSNGFSISGARYSSAPTSFFSGAANNAARRIQSVETIAVRASDVLTLRVWYDIESGWDYAYVEVSTDGVAFTPIAGTITTNDDPHGYNRGNGITGSSGGWTLASFGLAVYAGQSVYLRVSYETDGSQLGEGIYVDDITPVEGYASETVISSALTDTSFAFTDKPTGTYYYRVRAQDAQGQWGPFSAAVPTVVTDGEYQCVDSDLDGFGDPGYPDNDCPTDNCPAAANPDQADGDADGVGDVCDLCPNDAQNDGDADGHCGDVDNCPLIANADQADADLDGVGDACCCALRGDSDGDGAIKVGDLTMLVAFLFRGGAGPGCPAHADVNGDGGPAVSDLTMLVGYLFRGGEPPAACP